MDNSDYSRKRHTEHLGVNKMGKNIRKSPLHQPNFANLARQQPQPQPQVYNINKNDFRNIVQQLTGSPSHHSQEPLPRPPQNPPKSPSMRLQRIRPPPLSPINVNRPRMLVHPTPQIPPQHAPSGGVPLNESLARPAQYGQAPPQTMVPPPPVGSGDHTGWANTAESPVSYYMRYLQHSINDSAQGHPQTHPHHMQGQQQQSSGLLPFPPVPPLPSPRMNGPSPRMNGPPLVSPRTKGLLPSPTSQFLLPSPSGYLNLSSPRSPYPLLSPGCQHPPPLTPNTPFSSMGQPGILGPGPRPLPSPGFGFPLSPGYFPLLSPRWRD